MTDTELAEWRSCLQHGDIIWLADNPPQRWRLDAAHEHEEGEPCWVDPMWWYPTLREDCFPTQEMAAEAYTALGGK